MSVKNGIQQWFGDEKPESKTGIGLDLDMGIITSGDGLRVTIDTSIFTGKAFNVYDKNTSARVFSVGGNGNLVLGTSSNIFIGEDSGDANTTGQGNMFNGYQAGYSNTTGYKNIFMGYQAGYNNTTGVRGVFIGEMAGYNNTTGNDNICIGKEAGKANVSSLDNIFIGYNAGIKTTVGDNIFIGNAAGYYNITGSGNVVLGAYAGNNLLGGKNVCIGWKAGFSEEGSDKLYIENSTSSTPLIYGEFDNDFVTINDNLGIKATAFGTNANGVLGISNGTVPASSPANMIQIYSKDSSDGAANATLGLRTEQAVEAIGTFTPSHKLKIWHNETEYWIQLDAV